jgi:hypothetical protein
MVTPQEFLKIYATPLVDELKAVEGLKKFITNSDVIGAHAEAAVRRLIRRVVEPLHVSTGAVISEQLCSNPQQVPQLDTIIWQPCPAPAIFEIGDFGIVPQGSSLAVMEIKRSAYSGVGKKLKERLDQALVKMLVAGDPPGWPGTDQPELYPDYPALGVVCLRETSATDTELEDLIARGHCVVILEKCANEVIPNVEGVYRLLNFLIRTRARAKAWDGVVYINMKAIG